MTTTTIAPATFNTEAEAPRLRTVLTDALTEAQLQQLQGFIETKQFWDFVSESIHQGLHDFAQTLSSDEDAVCDIQDQLLELVSFDGVRIEGLKN